MVLRWRAADRRPRHAGPRRVHRRHTRTDTWHHRPARRCITEAAQRAGWTLQTIRRHPTFCRFILDRDDDTVELDLAVDSPLLEPPTAIDGIPVLTPLDLAARKVLAIVDRLEARDYTDLHALAHLIGQQTCIDSALTMDAGLSVSAIAEAFERIDRIADDRYPERATDAATTRRYFTTWAHELLDDH